MRIDHVRVGNCLDVLKEIPNETVDCCVTSPPYFGLRDYGVDEQIGLEETPEQYIEKLVDVFSEVKRVLKKDGTLWLNIGDSYAGSGRGPAGNLDKKNDPRNMTNSEANKAKVPKNCKPKDLIGIPWMLAFALRSDGWYLRQDIIWHKPNPMPESVKDRCTKSHEYIFLLSKSPHYYFDYEAIQEDCVSTVKENSHIKFGGNKYGDNKDHKFDYYSGNEWNPTDKRNKRDVWSITTKAVKESHFATFPEDLVRPCILAGCKVGGVVLDPFFGSGTTGRVAMGLNRHYMGIELNPEYAEIANRRANNVQMTLDGFFSN